MNLLETVGVVASVLGTLGVGTFAYLRTRGAREERGEKRLWKRVETLEAEQKKRDGECKEEISKLHAKSEAEREECAESIGALQQMLFRTMGVGDDTGRIIFDEVRSEVRSSIQTQRSLPPPARREEEEK